jgi:integrase
LTDVELANVVQAARVMETPYGSIVEMLALTGQRREEVAGATWDEFDLDRAFWTIPSSRTKNAKSHIVHLTPLAIAILRQILRKGPWVFTITGNKPFRQFSACKRDLDALSGVNGWRLHDLRRTCVSGMARLGVAPHVADKVLNHQAGTISGVAAVYQRHDFLAERREAMLLWDQNVRRLLAEPASSTIRRVAWE